MNKKRLSVVMAGAMLATSVAPVLAAETTGTEIAYDQLATFKSDLLAKMAEKKISGYAIFKTAGFVDTNIARELNANTNNDFSSAYGIKITGKDGIVKEDTTYTTTGLAAKLNKIEAGDKVEIFERDTTEFKGQLIPGTGLKMTVAPAKYITTDLTTGIAASQNAIAPTGSVMVTDKTNNVTKDAKEDKLNVVTEKRIDPVGGDDASNKLTLSYKVGEEKVDGRLPIDEKGNLLDYKDTASIQKLADFDKLATWTPSSEAVDKGAELVATYTIGEKTSDESKETVKVSDLYDGIALTAKGTEILADLKNAEKTFDAEGNAKEESKLVKITALSNSGNLDANGVVKFQVAYYKNGKLAFTDKGDAVANAEKVITVVSNNKNEMASLYKLITSGEFKVGVVAGQDRYATAVSVAKQVGVTKLDAAKNATSKGNNIVLVNGESLVDGLAAAPLAADLGCYQVSNGTSVSSPLLLTKSNELPEATKEYLEGLVSEFTSAQKKAVKIHLVGGSSVLNSELVKELKEMGFSVERHGGDNREETSLKVAKAMNSGTAIKEAFVVGANGEADAMSISAVAVENGAPIIVAKAGGISEEALDYLEEVKADDVTIVGGTTAVTEKEEADINKALVGAKAMRIAGKNRIETNNAIIEKYYKGSAEGVIVVKDGIANKKELVDALSAANYAAVNDAPIVLATNKVTDTQKSTLLKAKVSSNFDLLAQVGMGAERTVLESLAELLDISNK